MRKLLLEPLDVLYVGDNVVFGTLGPLTREELSHFERKITDTYAEYAKHGWTDAEILEMRKAVTDDQQAS